MAYLLIMDCGNTIKNFRSAGYGFYGKNKLLKLINKFQKKCIMLILGKINKLKKVDLELNIHSYEDVQKWAIAVLEKDPNDELALEICFLSTANESFFRYCRQIIKKYLMIMYLCDYTIRDPKQHGTRINIKEIGWLALSTIIKDIFHSGGSIRICKTRTEYLDEYLTFSYQDLDHYYMICDEKHGYILGFNTEEGLFTLLNKNNAGTQKIYTFHPYDDEYDFQYVHQDLELATKIFKEIYDSGHISIDSKKLFKEH